MRNEVPGTASDSEGSGQSDGDKYAQLLSNSRVPSIYGERDPFCKVRTILELLRRRSRADLQPE